MKNKQITAVEDNQKYWVSRSVAVACFIFTIDDKGECRILANKRGKGCPDFVGYWNCPCGYLDYDETGEEAVAREVFEETGLEIDPQDLLLFGVNTDPVESNKQNVTLRYCTFIEDGMDRNLSTEYSEKDEVSEVEWIKGSDMLNKNWAFNHQYRILEAFDVLFGGEDTCEFED